MESDYVVCSECIKKHRVLTGLEFDYTRCDECSLGCAKRREDASQGKGFGKHNKSNPLWNITYQKTS